MHLTRPKATGLGKPEPRAPAKSFLRAAALALTVQPPKAASFSAQLGSHSVHLVNYISQRHS